MVVEVVVEAELHTITTTKAQEVEIDKGVTGIEAIDPTEIPTSEKDTFLA